MTKYTDEQILSFGLNPQTIPQHVAIIMDGNGRWAKKRGFPRSAGHRAGTERLHGIIRMSSDLGVKALTLYAFSTENWKRPKEEVNLLMGLFIEYFNREIEELHRNHVRIRAIGDISMFPNDVQKAIENAHELTKCNDGLQLNIAMNYGSRAEILRAANLAAQVVRKTGEPITEELFESFFYTVDTPEPDLLIRTSGEQRLSNFLLYQLSYAEMIFTETYWPDFSDEEYIKALKTYAKRSRRYGGLSEEKK